MKKIFCYIVPVNVGHGYVAVEAIGEDGVVLAGHISSSVEWAKIEIEYPTKLRRYEEHFPEGYELEWVDDPENHSGVKKAFALNRHEWFKFLIDEGKSREEALDTVWGSNE